MKRLPKDISYGVAALGVLGSITGILAYESPSSAAWLNAHGFIGWPIAVLFMILFAWAVTNWRQAHQELDSIRARMREPVKEDRLIFETFKERMPRDSAVLAWLRDWADQTHYRRSDVSPLHEFWLYWKSDAQPHFIDPDMEHAATELVNSIGEFLDYQGVHSEWAPREHQMGRGVHSRVSVTW